MIIWVQLVGGSAALNFRRAKPAHNSARFWTTLDTPYFQGRINLYANYAMAWGPPRQGGPRGGRRYFSHQYQFGDCNYVCTLLSKNLNFFVSRFSWYTLKCSQSHFIIVEVDVEQCH